MGSQARIAGTGTVANGNGTPLQLRRYDHDVTNTVDVSSANSVRDAIRHLFLQQWPDISFDELWVAFHDFERLFTGRLPGYAGCDTVYHDIQHSLDVTLAMARLLVGYERTVSQADRLGPDRAVLGVIVALFHDAGYIRDTADQKYRNGAEVTKSHVSRSAAWLQRYLPQIGMVNEASRAAEIVHFSGYEKQLDQIELEDPRDSMIGHLLGTADLVAQMADRCYLEKCRDRLYLEFVLGGIAIEDDAEGVRHVKYKSGIDLLLQTPDFYKQVVKKRIDKDFNKAYRYLEAVFDGNNPYVDFMERNMAYLEYIIETGQWPLVRRQPPCFTVKDDAVAESNVLVTQHIQKLRAATVTLAQAS